MSESNRYTSRQLIQVASIANALAIARGVAAFEAVKQLAEAAEHGRLNAVLWMPHEKWKHDGNPERNKGKSAGNPLPIWKKLARDSEARHHGSKDDFNLPPMASTYHLLAADLHDLEVAPQI